MGGRTDVRYTIFGVRQDLWCQLLTSHPSRGLKVLESWNGLYTDTKDSGPNAVIHLLTQPELVFNESND